MAEMQGRHALKQFVRKGGMSFSRISHTRCLRLSGSVICCEIKNYRHKNVIMVVYAMGKVTVVRAHECTPRHCGYWS